MCKKAAKTKSERREVESGTHHPFFRHHNSTFVTTVGRCWLRRCVRARFLVSFTHYVLELPLRGRIVNSSDRFDARAVESGRKT